MQNSSRFACLAVGVVAAASFVACSNGGTGTQSFTPTAAMNSVVRDASPLARVQYIAVSDYMLNVVNIYNANGKKLQQLTGFNFPNSLAIDRKGNLYVADTHNRQVEIYAPGFTSPPKILSIPDFEEPSGVASFANGTVVAVANYGTVVGRHGDVMFFTNGKLTSVISDPSLTYVDYCTFDAYGNLYVDGFNGVRFTVGEIVGGVNGRSFTPLTTSNTIMGGGNIHVTTDGRIAILDHYAKTLYTYDPPKNGSLGKPVTTTKLDPKNGTDETFAFTADMHDLYETGNDTVREFSFPSGAPVDTFQYKGDSFNGVAVFPPEVPGK